MGFLHLIEFYHAMAKSFYRLENHGVGIFSCVGWSCDRPDGAAQKGFMAFLVLGNFLLGHSRCGCDWVSFRDSVRRFLGASRGYAFVLVCRLAGLCGGALGFSRH